MLSPLVALAQTYPSPTFHNLTVNGTLTNVNGVTLSSLAQQAANTVLANATGSMANVTAFSMPSCSTSSSALNWTSGTGFACNASINAATLGNATFAAPGPIGSTTASTGAFTGLTTSTYNTFTVNNTTNATDGPAHYFIRNVSVSGGTAGNVNNTVKVIDNVNGAGETTYEWGFLSQLNNSATAGQNVAVYGQGNKLAAGPTWGGVFDAQDHTGTANPTGGLIGTEIDLTGNGTDNNNARIGIDMVGFNYASGTTPVFGIGFRMGPYQGLSTNGSFTTGMQFNGGYGNVIDTSNATITGSALRLAAGQTIGLDVTSTNTLSYVAGTGLAYKNSGANAFTVSTSGVASAASFSANAALAAGTTLNVTGLSTLTGGIATAGGTAASAATQGYLLINSATGVSLTSTSVVNITSVLLTPGVWDCQGTVQYSTATSISQEYQGITTTGGTLGGLGTYTEFTGTVGASAPSVWSTPVVSEAVSTNTTVYLVASSNFTGTQTASGSLRCRLVH